MAMKTKKKKILTLLTDASVPLEMRRDMLRQLLMAGEDDTEQVIAELLEAASLASAGEQYVEKTKELAELLNVLEEGPLRSAIFDRTIDSERLGRRARVLLQDGGIAFCVVPDAKLGEALQCGDTVWLDTQGRAVLFQEPEPANLGERAQLERVLPQGDVEVSLNEMGHIVCRPSARLVEQIERGEAEPGCTLVVCQRRMMAFHALPSADGPSHLLFLSQDPVPDVIVERDVGSPPAFIEEFAEHVRRELTHPEIGRRYGLRPARLLLATGVAGSGKTLSIQAFWRRMYEVVSEVTGTPIESLPQRVLKLRASDVLSKWLGEADRRMARFFAEVEKVAAETFVAPDGTEWQLPVLVICEEIDALARQRGDDGIHDRIQTTLLAELDPANSLFRDHLAIVIATTNVPSLLDPAFVRRAGGIIVTFDRMNRFQFKAVLQKHLGGRPFQSGSAEGVQGANGDKALCRRAVAELTHWLFAERGDDAGQVELTFVGQPNPVVKRRRDFLTGALVDRAVQQACFEACMQDWKGADDPGLTTEALICALDAQVRNIVDQLTPGNCEQYLNLPDATRVATVRRIEPPPLLPIELERAS